MASFIKGSVGPKLTNQGIQFTSSLNQELYITSSDLNVTGTSDLYISCWFKTTSLLQQRIFGRSIGLYVEISGDTLYVYFNNVIVVETNRVYVFLNNWYHLALIRKNGKLGLCVNGILDGFISDNTDISDNFDLYLGNTLDGYIDDFEFNNSSSKFNFEGVEKNDMIFLPERRKSNVKLKNNQWIKQEEESKVVFAVCSKNSVSISGKIQEISSGVCDSVFKQNDVNLQPVWEYNNGFVFNTIDNMECTSFIALEDKFSIDFWFMNTTSGNQTILTKYIDANNNFTIEYDTSKIYMKNKVGGITSIIMESNYIVSNDWKHICIVKDGIYKLYVDNIFIFQSISTTNIQGGGKWVIGGNFSGKIDNFLVINKIFYPFQDKRNRTSSRTIIT